MIFSLCSSDYVGSRLHSMCTSLEGRPDQSDWERVAGCMSNKRKSNGKKEWTPNKVRAALRDCRRGDLKDGEILNMI